MSFTAKITKELKFNLWECCVCDAQIALAERHEEILRESEQSFYCPRGHRQSFRDGEVDKLKSRLQEQIRIATQMADRAKSAELGEQAAVTELKRIKKRINAGVCTCCNRTFQNLARHMKTKHGDQK